jgi:periplasmic protein CpxP/Spy
MIFRALASALSAGSIGLAWLVLAAGPAPAEDSNTSPAPNGPAAPAADPTAARVKYLHDRLRITAEQEELWDKVGQAMHDNALALAPLLKQRLRATTSGSGPELLHAYEALGETQVDSQRKIIAAFEPLYASLSESQKKIADAVIREGAQSAMFVPLVPPPFTSSLAFPSIVPPVVYPPTYPPVTYPAPWSGPGSPITVRPAVAVRHFHGFGSPRRHAGRFHRQ